MRVKQVLFWGVLAGWMTLGAVAAAQPEPPAPAPESGAEACEVEAIEGGVRCVAAGQVVAEVVHPALYGAPGRYRENQGGRLPVGPVRLGGRAYYGVRAELLAFDVEARAVVERVALPAPLVAMERVEGEPPALRLTLAGDPPTELRYTPGEAVAWGGPWRWSETLGAMQDAMWLPEVDLAREPGAVSVPDPDALSPGPGDSALLQAMEARARGDRTNLYFDLYRAEALLRLERHAPAVRAANDAANAPAPWYDLLRASMRLHYRGLHAPAERAFERALIAMVEAGVRPEALTSPVALSFATLWSRDLMDSLASHEPGSAGEGPGEHAPVVSAVELLQRLETIAPNAEGLPAARRALGLLPVAQAGPAAVVERAVRQVDQHLALGLGLLLALLGGGAVVGLGRGQSRRRVVGDGLMFGALLAMSFWNLGELGRLAQQASVVWAMPDVVGSDALTSPEARAWLQALEPSGERAQLLEVSGATSQARARGDQPQALLEGHTQTMLVGDALLAHLQATAIESPAELESSPAVREEFGWLDAVRALDLRGSRGALVAGGLLLNALLLGGLVWMLVGGSPALGQRVRRWWPGAPRGLGPARMVVWTMFCVGVAGLSPLSGMVRGATDQVWAGYYGLGAVAGPPGLQLWALALLVVALALHLGAVVFARLYPSGGEGAQDIDESSGQAPA
ncbi:hypothetical protein DL240_09275 [Lujinxingia litoralis]|uniref:Uncharacterized protein n=1 Tax=Lujinxingia litoralis TaxID=2211119 RepID=A0A328C719_9DELT|nr:hypothetical protein [Lujinxingia litoralis]RAL23066.1 hypothetical protein DL240_09275 [Lujinxingia litoralis]